MVNQFFSLRKPYLALSITVLLLASLAFVSKTSFSNSTHFLSALTVDFALVIPFIYFLLIRKSNIPKTTVVPIFIIGLVVASYVIPKQNQTVLSLIKTWILPIVEISVFTYVFIKVRKLILKFKKTKQDNLDFYDALKQTTKQLLPSLPGNLLAMEVSVLYYGVFKWKKNILKPNQFTYHKNSGTPTLLGALIFLIAVETVSIHLLLMKWSMIAAIIALILSVYSGFQILGFLKSLLYRPINLTNDTLYLKYGILAETTISTKNIESISHFTKDLEKDSEIKKLSPLGGLESHNLLIQLKEPEQFFGLYGTKKEYQSIVLFVDEKTKFKCAIESLIH